VTVPIDSLPELTQMPTTQAAAAGKPYRPSASPTMHRGRPWATLDGQEVSMTTSTAPAFERC
jgi:hypothetical protein